MPPTARGATTDPARKARPNKTASRGTRKRRKPDPIKAWVTRLNRTRPGIVPYVLDGLATLYGHPTWQRRLEATSELILTILTQSTADVNAEHAFQALRAAYPSNSEVEHHVAGPGWGGVGLPDGRRPDWLAVELAPYDELVEVIRPGGLPFAKAKSIQATLRTIREQRGDHSLEFLRDMSAAEARDWLTKIPGIGKKTASVLLLFSFGMPLMPVDRHVERVSRRIGLLPRETAHTDPHDVFLAMLQPDQMYEAHVNLIRHGRLVCDALRPKHELCPLRDRCRFVNPKAP